MAQRIPFLQARAHAAIERPDTEHLNSGRFSITRCLGTLHVLRTDALLTAPRQGVALN